MNNGSLTRRRVLGFVGNRQTGKLTRLVQKRETDRKTGSSDSTTTKTTTLLYENTLASSQETH
jgi:hypothetical protein